VIDKVRPGIPAGIAPKPPRRRHWWRLIAAGAAALVVLIVAAVGLFIKLQPTQPPLALPTAPASAPAGPLAGTWTVAAGSEAGFRVRESALGFGNDVVGRTGAVTGTLTVSADSVTRAAFTVGLTTIKVGGKVPAQLAASLDTRAYPTATFTLSEPVRLDPAFASGATITSTVAGLLSMHGSSHPVTATISGRRDGHVLQLAGSIQVNFSVWDIAAPGGFGFLGSLAGHGVAEFSLSLLRAP